MADLDIRQKAAGIVRLFRERRQTDALPAELYPAGDQSFEFERTASRLMEMRGEAYLAQPRRDAEWKQGVVD